MDIDTFVPVSSSIFTRPIAVVLGLIALFGPKNVKLLETERVSFLRSMTAAWSHGVYTCVLLFVKIYVVPSGVWKLEVYKKKSEVFADFF